uniref:Uncharacterized protein n=1 Tax=Anguilla anguilla TaxID=7936 RepID=A0A0E9PUV4_ANGAN
MPSRQVTPWRGHAPYPYTLYTNSRMHILFAGIIKNVQELISTRCTYTAWIYCARGHSDC